MYVQGSEACGLPNSETPMSQQAIDDQFAFGQSVGTAFDDGDNALNSLIQQLGGNPAGATLDGASGVPTTGTLDTDIAGIPVVPDEGNPTALLPDINNPSSWAWAASPAAPQILPGGGAGYRAPQGEQTTQGLPPPVPQRFAVQFPVRQPAGQLSRGGSAGDCNSDSGCISGAGSRSGPLRQLPRPRLLPLPCQIA